jgi:glycosyltransferase involved in cell wall biosynthesis
MSDTPHLQHQRPLVTVIMPAFNAAPYIRCAIDSVLDQTWQEWELIVINDGSRDDTAAIARSYADARIRLLEQPNRGVSSARNRGLDEARGQYVAFLDADDRLPPGSLEARARILDADPLVQFVDGVVMAWEPPGGTLTTIHAPDHRGPVFDRLTAMDEDIFFGPSWMIRRSVIGEVRLPTHFTHAEDLAFYMTIARQGIYATTPEQVLHYRVGHSSAMSDLRGLHRGYVHLLDHAATIGAGAAALLYLRRRMRSIMVRSYIKKGLLLDALRTALLPLARSVPR